MKSAAPSAEAYDIKRVASIAPFVHEYMAECPAGPVRSHETGEN